MELGFGSSCINPWTWTWNRTQIWAQKWTSTQNLIKTGSQSWTHTQFVPLNLGPLVFLGIQGTIFLPGPAGQNWGGGWKLNSSAGGWKLKHLERGQSHCVLVENLIVGDVKTSPVGPMFCWNLSLNFIFDGNGNIICCTCHKFKNLGLRFIWDGCLSTRVTRGVSYLFYIHLKGWLCIQILPCPSLR